MWHHDGMGWWMVVGSIWMVLFWAVIIALVVWGARKLPGRGGSGSGATDKRDPLDIAKERYAKGDISKEEFDQIKKDLS
jgi:putative membrane protein